MDEEPTSKKKRGCLDEKEEHFVPEGVGKVWQGQNNMPPRSELYSNESTTRHYTSEANDVWATSWKMLRKDLG